LGAAALTSAAAAGAAAGREADRSESAAGEEEEVPAPHDVLLRTREGVGFRGSSSTVGPTRALRTYRTEGPGRDGIGTQLHNDEAQRAARCGGAGEGRARRSPGARRVLPLDRLPRAEAV